MSRTAGEIGSRTVPRRASLDARSPWGHLRGVTKPRVVIIGAGFGGLQCARRLAGGPLDILLLDRHNYHLFTPLLYQVASALLNPSEVAIPVRSIFRRPTRVRFRVATVTVIDLATRVVRTEDGDEIAYDYLVIAAGSRTNFFGLESVERSSHGVKDLSDALALRNHVLACFEAALREEEPAARLRRMTFVIVGGGPTGVEYAGALLELFRLVLVRDFPDLDVDRARVVLLEARDRLLSEFPPELGAYALERLEHLGVEVRLGAAVAGVEGDRVVLSDAATIPAATLIWAAGVRPAGLADDLEVPRDRAGRIEVDEFLRVRGSETAYAIGDIAAVPPPAGPVPMMAPPAMQAGRHAAANILRSARGRPLEPFRYRDKGIMATIGRNAGVARIAGMNLKGFIGWAAWLLVHFYFLIGFRNRLIVLIEWGWNYFRYDRPIRIISRPKPSGGKDS